MRVVSLSPSATEIIGAIGKMETLVGRSHRCDFPVAARRLPVCTAATPVDESPATLPAPPKAKVLIDQILLLKPDLVVGSSAGDVLTIPSNVSAFFDSARTPRFLLLPDPASVDDVWENVRALGEALEANVSAEAVVQRWRLRTKELLGRIPTVEASLSTVMLESIDPPRTASGWRNDLLRSAGVPPMEKRRTMDWPALTAADPEIFIVAVPGAGIEEVRAGMQLLRDLPDWPSRKAVVNNRVFLVDGRFFLHRPGPRVVESLEILLEILYPDDFSFGHRSSGWQYL